MISVRFRKFLIVGASGTALDFAFFYLFFDLLGWPLILANSCSYGIGLTSSFFINRAWTFCDSSNRSARRVWLSLFWGYSGLALNTLLVWAIATIAHVWIGKVIAVFVVVVFNYVTNKYFVFSIPHPKSTEPISK